MSLFNRDFFEHRTKKWWVGLVAFFILFFIGVSNEFGCMELDPIKPAGETLARYQMMMFCFLLLLIYFIPFVFFVRYSCKKMHVSQKLPVIAFFSGWFIPGWIAGELNDDFETLLRHLTSKSFVKLWGDAVTAPMIEESLKLLPVVLLLILIGYRRREHFLITGMCAGMGFEISEDLSYIEQQVSGSHKDFVTAVGFTLNSRVSGIISHWCYTALAAVAIWIIFYQKKKKQGILLLLVPVISHFLWDSPINETGALAEAAISTWTFLVFLRVWAKTLPVEEENGTSNIANNSDDYLHLI